MISPGQTGGKRDATMKEQGDGVGEGRKGSNERDTLIEGAIMDLGRNLALGKFQRIYKNDPI